MTNPFLTEDSALDAEIARVYSHLSTFSAEDKEYQQAVDQLSKLYKLKHEQSRLNLDLHEFENKHTLEIEQMEVQREKENTPWIQRVDPNTVLTVAANIVIGLAVIKYEQTGVISTRVRDFMKKI